MMMLAGVIGASFVLRSGLPASEWPQPSWVKSHWCIGMVTIVLLLSICGCLWKEQRSRSATNQEATNTANRFPWIAFALAFAAFSICVIGLDYQSKISLGLFPNGVQPMVHAKADLNYLSNVSTVANGVIASLEQQTKPDSQTQQKLDRWKLIRGGLIEWTRRKVGRSGDPAMRKLSLHQMADQIYRTRPDSRLTKFAQDETAETTQQLESDRTKLKESESENAVAIQSLKQSIQWLQQRQQYLQAFADPKNPIRDSMRQSLPKVIPGGPTWIAYYWLLTGFLSAQLIVGTGLLGLLILRKPQGTNSDSLQNVTACWYFIAATGIIVSLLVWIL